MIARHHRKHDHRRGKDSPDRHDLEETNESARQSRHASPLKVASYFLMTLAYHAGSRHLRERMAPRSRKLADPASHHHESRPAKHGRRSEQSRGDRAEEHDRGRHAHKPSEIPAKGWKDILKRVMKETSEDNISIVAAGVAFYLLIGIIPALAALISIYGLISDPAQVQQQFANFSAFLPGAVTDLLGDQMKRIASDTKTAGWGAVLGILIAIYGGSSALKAVVTGLNVAYEEHERRGFIKLTIITLLLTVGAVVTGIVAIGAIVALPAIFGFLGFGDNAALIANLIRWPLLAVLAIFSLSLLYRFGPSRKKPRWRWVTWGSTVATILWVVGSALFAFYAGHFANYNKTYGSLGAVVILLMWLYVSAFVVLLGAELNAQMELQTTKDSTVEPPKPMGARGAHAADELGESYP